MRKTREDEVQGQMMTRRRANNKRVQGTTRTWEEGGCRTTREEMMTQGRTKREDKARTRVDEDKGQGQGR